LVADARFAATANGPLPPESGASAQTNVAERPAATPNRVDGECGRCQVFDLAMTGGGESNSDAMGLLEKPAADSRSSTMQVAKILETVPNRRWSLDAVAGIEELPAMPGRASSRDRGERAADPADDADGPNGFDGPRNPPAVSPVTRSDVTGVDLSPPTSRVAPIGPEAKDARHDSAVLPFPATDPGDAERRAVFAEIAENAAGRRMVPTPWKNHRPAVLVGLAVLSFAGPHWTERWQARTASSPTTLQPPRRRGPPNS
jgi:hypothetical protein